MGVPLANEPLRCRRDHIGITALRKNDTLTTTSGVPDPSADDQPEKRVSHGGWHSQFKPIRQRAEAAGVSISNLGGHLKTGHTWSLQNRPMESGRDESFLRF